MRMATYSFSAWQLISALSLVLAGSTGYAHAQSPVECAPAETHADPTRYLRQLTLDLYDRIPTEAEYEAVRVAGAVTEELLDGMLANQEHLLALRRYHQSLLLGTTAPLPQVVGKGLTLNQANASTYYLASRGGVYRNGNASCVNLRHDQFDAEGAPVALGTWYPGRTVTNAAGASQSAPITGGETCTSTRPCRMDGWVDVEPYWAPGTTIRLCAFDAQAAVSAPDASGASRQCDPRHASNANVEWSTAARPRCGCGLDLAYCFMRSGHPSVGAVRAAITEEPLRIFEDVISSGADYYDAFTTRDTFVNGVLARYLRSGGGGVVYDPRAAFPELAYDADWQRVTRGMVHSGVLTTAAYLIRFMSHRARVAHFREAFLCTPFPETSLPATEADPPVNLAVRSGCSGCHAMIEPATQYWGRFRVNTSYGAISYAATLGYDALRTLPAGDACRTCIASSCTDFCNLTYYTASNTPSSEPGIAGVLQVAAFDWGAAGLDDDRARFEGGPRAYVMASLAASDATSPSAMERCTARRRVEGFLQRTVLEDEEAWVDELALDFRAGGHDFLALERAILADPRYRRTAASTGGPTTPVDCSTGSSTQGQEEVNSRCSGCHHSTSTGTLTGSTTAANLTQLGSRSDEAVVRAIRDGIGADGSTLCDGMPRFTALSTTQACDIVAYLRTLAPTLSTTTPNCE